MEVTVVTEVTVPATAETRASSWSDSMLWECVWGNIDQDARMLRYFLQMNVGLVLLKGL